MFLPLLTHSSAAAEPYTYVTIIAKCAKKYQITEGVMVTHAEKYNFPNNFAEVESCIFAIFN